MSIWDGTSGPHDADIMIVGEAWGQEEARVRRPFVGNTGEELTKILAESKIDRQLCFLTNVVPAQPLGNKMWRFFHPRDEARKKGIRDVNGLHPLPNVQHGLHCLYEQIKEVRPKVIIAAGNYALWALSDEIRTDYKSSDADGTPMEGGGRVLPKGITDFRGSMLRTNPFVGAEVPLLPITHPAAIFRDWSARHLIVYDLRNRVPQALQGDWDGPRHKINSRPSFVDVVVYLNGLLRELHVRRVRVSIDLETYRGLVTCISFCYVANEALTIPFLDKKDDMFSSYWTPRQEAILIRMMRAVCTHENFGAIGQNFRYDQSWCEDLWGFLPPLSHDTMLAHHMMFPGTPKGLGHLSSMYCRYHRYWKDDNQAWDAKNNMDDHLYYNAEDAIRTLEIANEELILIKQMGMEELWQERLKVADWFYRVERKGIAYDVDKRKRILLDLIALQEQYQTTLFRLIPQTLIPPPKTKSKTLTPWFGSPKQTLFVLYELLMLPLQKNKKTKRPTTDDDALNALSRSYPEFAPLFRLILELRSIGVYIDNFLSAIPEPGGNRLRCTLDPTGTETFRAASYKNPQGRGLNFQNIPD